MFVVGFRKRPDRNRETQRVGAVVLKRTYDINPATGMVRPSAASLPLFLRDKADNLVMNSGFDPDLGDWQAKDGVMLTQVSGPQGKAMQVTGAANGRIVQTISFDEPLGGRTFSFSFSAMVIGPAPATVAGVQLEAADHVICALSAELEPVIPPALPVLKRVCATGTWPPDMPATKMQVILRAAGEGEPVVYDNVQVEERDYVTEWDPTTTLFYEHDLFPFKPEGDLIVLGFADGLGVNRVYVNGLKWLERTLTADGRDWPMERPKALFGWEPRLNSDREAETGTISKNPDDYPPQWPVTTPNRDPLPPDFKNRFYNGYRRSNGSVSAAAPFAYLPAAAQIEIERPTQPNYRFTLRGDTVTASFYTFAGDGPDEESHWQGTPVTMNLDTLVIEPEANRCYLVWRGTWNFDDHSEGNYRRLLVQATT